MEIKQLTEQIVTLLESKKGKQIKVLNMEGITALADYFILVNAGNKKHSQALADEVTKLLTDNNIELLRENGYREGTWILQDFGSIIVHIFVSEERTYYDLDTMWGDAKIEQQISGDQ